MAPRQGNPPPRLWETPAGLINSIGLPNRGLEGFLAEDLPELARLPVPLVVSVMGFSRDELATLASAVGARAEVAMLELNVSCPNVETGLVMGADPEETALAVARVRAATDKPLIVKLTPNATDPAAVAASAEDAGADAVSLVNTLKGVAFDPRTGRRWLGGGTGGVSGPAIRAVALEQVAAVASGVGIPVVGMGGIQSGATPPTSCAPARRASRWARRASATPWRAGAWRLSSPRRRRGCAPRRRSTAADPLAGETGLREASGGRQSACKPPTYRQVAATTLDLDSTSSEITAKSERNAPERSCGARIRV